MVTTIRLPDGLHKRLKREAEKRGMTLNAYVISILWNATNIRTRRREVREVESNRVLKVLKELEGVSYSDWVKIKSGIDDYYRAESTKETNRIQLADPNTIMQFVKNYSSTI